MGMSSYEVVRRAIEFETPDRLPVRFDTLGVSDVHHACWNQTGTGDNASGTALTSGDASG